MKKAVLMYMVLGVALLASVPSAKATNLPIGPAAVNGWILANTGLVSFTFGDGVTGTIREIVAADFTSPYGTPAPVGGVQDYYLSFVYQVVLSSTPTGAGLAALSGSEFNGFLLTAEAGCEIGGGLAGCTGEILPTSAQVDTVGETPTFSFGSEVTPGEWSSSVIVATNATNYTSGTATVQDNGSANFGLPYGTVEFYAPTTGYYNPPSNPPVIGAEPTTLSLMGMGLLGLLGLRKKRAA